MIGASGDLVFFLGAGASVNAGVPDTFGLIDAFKDHVADQPANSQALAKILEILEEWQQTNQNQDRRVDIELLLETLERLDHKDSDILLRFYDVTRYKLSGYADKRPLIEQLKDFVKSKGIVLSNNISYFQHFLGFITDSKPLDVFSVNYDTSIEQFCITYKLTYTDGFDSKWNPKLFEDIGFDLRLYKLHGSIMWYRTDRGDYVKIPTQTEHSETQLITGETAQALMLYPMRKWDYAEPLLELLIMLKRRLENARFAIVVGYSFRDDHIRNIFWDAAIRNPKLNLILISPSAHRIYRDRLRAYDAPSHQNDLEIPSALKGRVICLSYKFENVFSELRGHYLHHLREGLNFESTESRKAIRGERANWTEALKAYVDCNHMEKVEEIETKVDLATLFTANPPLMVDLTVKSVLNYTALEDYERALRWYERMRKLIIYNPLSAEIMRSTELVVRLGLKIADSSFLPFKHLHDQTLNTFKDFELKQSIMPLDRLAEAGSQLEAFQRLNRYLSFWSQQSEGYMTPTEYIQKRKELYTNDIKEFEVRCQEYAEKLALPSGDKGMEAQSILSDILRKIEAKEIRRIFETEPSMLKDTLLLNCRNRHSSFDRRRAGTTKSVRSGFWCGEWDFRPHTTGFVRNASGWDSNPP